MRTMPPGVQAHNLTPLLDEFPIRFSGNESARLAVAQTRPQKIRAGFLTVGDPGVDRVPRLLAQGHDMPHLGFLLPDGEFLPNVLKMIGHVGDGEA